jgi:predicted GH43/DUF377 family glycosyl hydrolase
MKIQNTHYTLLVLFFLTFVKLPADAQIKPEMYFTDNSSGLPIAKDPKIVSFKGSYWMYYSIPGQNNNGWHIGIAKSTNLTQWDKVGELNPAAVYEVNGLCAPGAFVKGDTLHLFYQTYGNKKKDAICHAWTTNGIDFKRDASNPIFNPTGDWTCGRAIDAEVVVFDNKYLLFFATRDTSFTIQKQGVAYADLSSNFSKNDWKQIGNESIMTPFLDWEKKCVEGASCIKKGKYLYMFYAGGYNNEPQQIGIARSKDGINWKRKSKKPFLTNGLSGSWNESESGHPDVFKDNDGKHWLFFQGNNTADGKSWYLSKIELKWDNNNWPTIK